MLSDGILVGTLTVTVLGIWGFWFWMDNLWTSPTRDRAERFHPFVEHVGCNYLSREGSVCDKCGQVVWRK